MMRATHNDEAKKKLKKRKLKDKKEHASQDDGVRDEHRNSLTMVEPILDLENKYSPVNSRRGSFIASERRRRSSSRGSKQFSPTDFASLRNNDILVTGTNPLESRRESFEKNSNKSQTMAELTEIHSRMEKAISHYDKSLAPPEPLFPADDLLREIDLNLDNIGDDWLRIKVGLLLQQYKKVNEELKDEKNFTEQREADRKKKLLMESLQTWMSRDHYKELMNSDDSSESLPEEKSVSEHYDQFMQEKVNKIGALKKRITHLKGLQGDTTHLECQKRNLETEMKQAVLDEDYKQRNHQATDPEAAKVKEYHYVRHAASEIYNVLQKTHMEGKAEANHFDEQLQNILRQLTKKTKNIEFLEERISQLKQLVNRWSSDYETLRNSFAASHDKLVYSQHSQRNLASEVDYYKLKVEEIEKYKFRSIAKVDHDRALKTVKQQVDTANLRSERLLRKLRKNQTTLEKLRRHAKYKGLAHIEEDAESGLQYTEESLLDVSDSTTGVHKHEVDFEAGLSETDSEDSFIGAFEVTVGIQTEDIKPEPELSGKPSFHCLAVQTDFIPGLSHLTATDRRHTVKFVHEMADYFGGDWITVADAIEHVQRGGSFDKGHRSSFPSFDYHRLYSEHSAQTFNRKDKDPWSLESLQRQRRNTLLAVRTSLERQQRDSFALVPSRETLHLNHRDRLRASRELLLEQQRRDSLRGSREAFVEQRRDSLRASPEQQRRDSLQGVLQGERSEEQRRGSLRGSRELLEEQRRGSLRGPIEAMEQRRGSLRGSREAMDEQRRDSLRGFISEALDEPRRRGSLKSSPELQDEEEQNGFEFSGVSRSLQNMVQEMLSGQDPKMVKEKSVVEAANMQYALEKLMKNVNATVTKAQNFMTCHMGMMTKANEEMRKVLPEEIRKLFELEQSMQAAPVLVKAMALANKKDKEDLKIEDLVAELQTQQKQTEAKGNALLQSIATAEGQTAAGAKEENFAGEITGTVPWKLKLAEHSLHSAINNAMQNYIEEIGKQHAQYSKLIASIKEHSPNNLTKIIPDPQLLGHMIQDEVEDSLLTTLSEEFQGEGDVYKWQLTAVSEEVKKGPPYSLLALATMRKLQADRLLAISGLPIRSFERPHPKHQHIHRTFERKSHPKSAEVPLPPKLVAPTNQLLGVDTAAVSMSGHPSRDIHYLKLLKAQMKAAAMIKAKDFGFPSPNVHVREITYTYLEKCLKFSTDSIYIPPAVAIRPLPMSSPAYTHSKKMKKLDMVFGKSARLQAAYEDLKPLWKQARGHVERTTGVTLTLFDLQRRLTEKLASSIPLPLQPIIQHGMFDNKTTAGASFTTDDLERFITRMSYALTQSSQERDFKLPRML